MKTRTNKKKRKRKKRRRKIKSKMKMSSPRLKLIFNFNKVKMVEDRCLCRDKTTAWDHQVHKFYKYSNDQIPMSFSKNQL